MVAVAVGVAMWVVDGDGGHDSREGEGRREGDYS